MVASNVRGPGLMSAEVPRLVGTYRFNWSRNQLQFHRAKRALSVLSAGGIETMLLKGAALTALGYYDRGSRVMADVDIMVRPQDAAKAVGLLGEHGWRRTPGNGPPVSQLTSIIHGIELTDGEGANLDLHWHMIHRACSPEADEPFWAEAVAVDFFEEETKVPAPSDLLLHAAVHGAAWMPAASFLWVCDGLALIRGGDIDWERLASLGVQKGVALPLERALSYLKLAFGVDVPQKFTNELEQAPTGALDRWQYAIEGGSGLGLITLIRDIGRYRSITSGRPFATRMRGLSPYLQTVWKLESGWKVPVWMVQEAARRSISSVTARRRPPQTRQSNDGA